MARLARKVIKKHNPFVIAVTGSVGKTSVKEAIYTVLYDVYGKEVRKNEGNLNAEIGIPLTILGYKSLPNKFLWPFFLIGAYFRGDHRDYPKYLVIEMGVEKPGDIKYFSTIVKPDIAVITSVTAAHLENFKSEKEYQDEKISIINHLKEGGITIANYDNEVLKKIANDKIFFVSVKNGAGDYRAEDIKISLDGTEFRITSLGHKISIKSKLVGEQSVYTSLFAFAVADKLGLPRIQTGKSLDRIKPVPGRMNVIEGINGIKIIDDTYNANPSSVKAAIDTLESLFVNNRKVLILGNMNELGAEEKNEHENVAKYAKNKVDFAIFAGKNAKTMFDSFGDSSKSKWFNTRDELIMSLGALIQKEDIILIKASQNGNFFEEIVKHLMNDKSKSKKLLVRQSNGWLRKKRLKRL